MDNQQSPDEQFLDKALDILREHFDTVQILATRHEASQNGTLHFDCGFGNYYARLGQLDIWLKQQRQASLGVYEFTGEVDDEFNGEDEDEDEDEQF